MSADQKHLVQILDFNVINYTSKRTGQPEQMKLAQCVITTRQEGQEDKIVVGELVMPKSLQDTPKGQYLAEFELSVGQDKRVGSRLARLHPLNVRPQPKAA